MIEKERYDGGSGGLYILLKGWSGAEDVYCLMLTEYLDVQRSN
jgi:hypothetical protein